MTRRGFTIIELGISLAVMAVLATIVVTAQGFLESSSELSAAQLVDSLRQDAETFAKQSGGAGGSSFAGLTTSTTLPGYPAMKSPWNGRAAVQAWPGDNTYVQICEQMPDPITNCGGYACGIVLGSALNGAGVNSSLSPGCTLANNCGLSGCVLSIVAR